MVETGCCCDTTIQFAVTAVVGVNRKRRGTLGLGWCYNSLKGGAGVAHTNRYPPVQDFKKSKEERDL
jgi:hypothetical protein